RHRRRRAPWETSHPEHAAEKVGASEAPSSPVSPHSKHEMAGNTAGHFDSSMIPKSGYRFSEKIMLKYERRVQRVPTSWKSSWLGALTVLLRIAPPGTRADA